MIVNFPPGAPPGRCRVSVRGDGSRSVARSGLGGCGDPRSGAGCRRTCRGRALGRGRLAAPGRARGGAHHTRWPSVRARRGSPTRCGRARPWRHPAGRAACPAPARPAHGLAPAPRPSAGAARRRRPARRPGATSAARSAAALDRFGLGPHVLTSRSPATPRVPAVQPRGVPPAPRLAQPRRSAVAGRRGGGCSASLSARSVTSAAVRCAAARICSASRLGQPQHPLGPCAETGVGRRGGARIARRGSPPRRRRRAVPPWRAGARCPRAQSAARPRTAASRARCASTAAGS